jgi:hypothetical protein
LYIVGLGRSGSTLIDNILGQVDGFFSAGELRSIWDSGMIENRRCGCGARFHDCELWQAILNYAFGSRGELDPKRLVELRQKHTRTRHLAKMWLRGGRWRDDGEEGYFRSTLGALYDAIFEVTGSTVVVDSSKVPTYGYVLSRMETVAVFVLHLIRDSRATAYSWSVPKPELDRERPSFMPRYSLAHSALIWDVWNVAAELLWSSDKSCYMRLHYEDFVANPQRAIHDILEMLGETDKSVPFVETQRVRLHPTHTVAGNPNRFGTGIVTIRPDVSWRSRMKPPKRALVTAMTCPLLPRYGYLRGGGYVQEPVP